MCLAPKMFLPKGDTCIVVRLELLEIAMLDQYLFESDAPDVTDFTEVITLPLLVLMYSRRTVWSLVSALFS